MPLFEQLQMWAEQQPEAVALTGPNHPPLSYAELSACIQRLSVQLFAAGLAPDDRIAVVLPNGSAMALTLLATMSVAACAPLNPNYSEQEFDFYLSDLNAKVLIVPEGGEPPAIQVAHQHEITVLTMTERFALTRAGVEIGVTAVRGSARERVAQAVALLLHTSGTTSRPKLVPLTQANLLISAQNLTRTLQLTPADRCLNVMPLFHIHGIVAGLLASLVSGGSVVCPSGFAAPEFFTSLQTFLPTWYTAVPTIHQAILAQAQHSPSSHHSLRFIRSSSSALPLQTLKDLEHTFRVPVIEAYGMTEAAHQMASNPLPPDPRKPGSVGRAAGPEVAIMSETGTLLPPGTTGEVVIRGANVTPGYENNPVANTAAFTGGWFRTGDQGYVDSDGYLFLTGRLKEIINRGGEKVAPREVDEVLLTHPSVAQAVTFAMPHPTLGEDVAAVVVLRPGHQETAVRIRHFLFGRLADFKIPSQIVIVNDIPKGPTGKLQRLGLHKTLEDQLRMQCVTPRNSLEKSIVAVIEEVLAISPVGVTDNFFALGGDSLEARRVLARLSSEFQVNLPAVSLFLNPTAEELSLEITRLLAEDTGLLEEILNEIEGMSDEVACNN
jgi:acyl-CoA synthetase (AMP-forming)/AMP-acid ligase II/acyl carrier protein